MHLVPCKVVLTGVKSQKLEFFLEISQDDQTGFFSKPQAEFLTSMS